VSTVITTHKNMDLDALGATIGLKKLYPEAQVVLPETKGEDVLRLLKENPNLFSWIDEKEFDTSQKIERLIVVDTSSLERIPDRLKEFLKRGVEVVVFDHHSRELLSAEVSQLHHKEAGSATSIVALILKGKGIVPSPYEASAMLTGIYSDTGSFRYPSTSAIDFLAAAYLLSVGAEIEFVRKYLPSELTDRDIDVLKLLKDNTRFIDVHGNRIGITYARLDEYHADVAPLISKLLELYSVPALFGVIESQGSTFLIGRSASSKVDASLIASHFGGGGHREAASALVKGKTAFEVMEELKEVLEESVLPLKTAKDIMTSPPITLEESLSVSQARKILMKNSINAAPITDGEGRILGIVNRALLDKAVYMGLEESPVREVMERDFFTVSPSDSVKRVEEIVVGKRQSFLPVVEGDRVVGVITRTDLLLNAYGGEPFGEKREERKSVAGKLKNALPPNLFNLVKKIGEIADREGVNAYLVGGFVRDLVIGRKNFDIDIVVEGDGAEFAKLLGRELGAKVHTFDRFKTATLVFEDGTRIDMASARTEVYKSPGALPEVESAPLRKDLMRRDFTINTLAVRINKERFGELLDFFGALRDIKEKKIRVLHSLSFVEDPTRILRALRFATRYRFTLGKNTEKLLRKAVEKKLFKEVEGQRIYHELKQIFSEENPLRVFLKMEKYGVIEELFPSIRWDRNKKDLFERVRKFIIWHKLGFPEQKTDYHITYFGALFFKENEKAVREILERLSPPPKERRLIERLFKEAPYLLKKLKEAKRPSQVYKILEKKPEELLLLLGAASEKVKEKVVAHMNRYRQIKPLVGGRELKELGLKPSPLFGQLISELKYAIIDGRVAEDDFQEQLSFLKEKLPRREDGAKEA